MVDKTDGECEREVTEGDLGTETDGERECEATGDDLETETDRDTERDPEFIVWICRGKADTTIDGLVSY